MVYWFYLDYVSPAGTNLIKKWSRKELTIQGREDLETLLSTLAKQKQWSKPDFKTLSGMNSGMGEFRFKTTEGTPLRVVGMKGNASGQYILLIGCSHKGKVYDPPDALETAVKRKRLLANKSGSTCEHEEDDGETEEE